MSTSASARRLTAVDWLILVVAVIGFAFDTYELLMMPVIAGPALAELLKVPVSDPKVREWIGLIFWGSAIAGGAFGLIGGWLTDRFGRRQVLTYSILVYSISACAAGLSTSVQMLFFFRCTTFIGVCVEFVAAVAWLAELFPNPLQREKVLGFTQAFSSVGGLMVTGANTLMVKYAADLPAIHGGHASWRYTLISGLLPALPLILIRPFLPESPVWQERRAAGTLRRPSLAELFSPALRRTTVVTTLLFACGYGAAFGAIQLTPAQIVPGLPEFAQDQDALKKLKRDEVALQKQIADPATAPADKPALVAKVKQGVGEQKKISDKIKQAGNKVQLYQEIGGLVGRVLLAILVLYVVGKGNLLRVFQIPGLLIVPLVFYALAKTNVDTLGWGLFLAGLLTVGQFSFWGNYLPQVYPVHLRGTGESFAANIGGRMLGTSAAYVTTTWFAPHMPGATTFAQVAAGAALMALIVYAVGLAASFWLPQPKAGGIEE